MYFILAKKVFVANDTFKIPPVQKNCIAPMWFWSILPHKLSSDLKRPPSFHLQHPGWWQQILVSVHCSIYPSFSYMKSASVLCWKTAPYHDVPTTRLHCWWFMGWCAVPQCSASVICGYILQKMDLTTAGQWWQPYVHNKPVGLWFPHYEASTLDIKVTIMGELSNASTLHP